MRAGLYARVSTHDQQTLGLQIEAMTAYIRDRSWDLVKQVEDIGSGMRERPGREGPRPGERPVNPRLGAATAAATGSTTAGSTAAVRIEPRPRVGQSGQRSQAGPFRGELPTTPALYQSMTTSDDRALELLHALLLVARESVAGYATAERNVPDARLWREFEPHRKARAKIATELEQRIRDLRGDPEQPPSAAAALHRRWIELRSSTASGPNHAVLAEVERGEALAARAFADALKEHDIDAATRKLFERQYEHVQAAHDRIKQLLERTPAIV